MKPENMKPIETREKKQDLSKKIYWAVAVLLLIYGGISLILFSQQAYMDYAREHIRNRIWTNISNLTAQNHTGFERIRIAPGPMYPAFVNFFGSIISIVGGICMILLLRKKEKGEIKKETINALILPDEKLVIEELEKNHGELTQSDLVRVTRLSKVKMSRIIKRLEDMGVVKKYPYGLTNKIRLEKSL